MRRLVKLTAFVGVFTLLTAPAAIAQGERPGAVTPLERTVAYVQPSVVYLDVEWTGWVFDTYNKNYLNDGDPFVLRSSCTGFVVNPDGYIATAGHCVDQVNVAPDFLDAGAAWAATHPYYVLDLDYETIRGFAEEDYRVEGAKKGAGGHSYRKGADLEVQAVWSTTSTEPLYDDGGSLNGETHDARVVRSLPWNDGSGDVALLKVEASDLPALPIAPPESVSTGTEVISIGYPASVGEVSDATLSDPSFKEGSISSIRTNAAYPVYEMSSSLSNGMSGGPTVDLQGRVVGINSYGIEGEVASFEFAQAASTLTEVMTDAGVPAELGEIGTAYRQGLDAYFAGEKETAVDRLGAVVAIDPEFDMAQQYLTKAEALEDPSSPILPIAAAVAAVLVLGGATAFFLVRRRRAKAPTAPTPVTAPAAGAVPTIGEAALRAETRTEATRPEPARAEPLLRPITRVEAPEPARAEAPVPVGAGIAAVPSLDGERPTVSPATPPASSHPEFCTHCGAHFVDDAEFCGTCGARRG